MKICDIIEPLNCASVELGLIILHSWTNVANTIPQPLQLCGVYGSSAWGWFVIVYRVYSLFPSVLINYIMLYLYLIGHIIRIPIVILCFTICSRCFAA